MKRVAFALVLVLYACSGGSEPTDPDPEGSAAAGLCVDTINQYRATVSAAPLSRWQDAEPCVSSQGKSDSETGKAHGAFGLCGEHAQDECPGWSGSYEQVVRDCLKMMWGEGPGGGHYENMKGGSSRVACGFFRTRDGAVWAVQDFQ